jgi:hypothetical protein
MSHYGGPPGGHQPPPEHHAPPQLGHGAPGYSHESYGVSSAIRGEVVKITSRAAPNFNLGILGDEVTVVAANDNDPIQQWIKDESWSNKAKDSAGLPAFALINKGTGKALRHPQLAQEKVTVTAYHQNALNEDVLWTESKDVGHGWHALRPVNNIKLNLDIDHGNKKYGAVKEGQAIIVFDWEDLENQHWKLEPITGTTASSHDHQQRW